jgi:hypothetical protein
MGVAVATKKKTASEKPSFIAQVGVRLSKFMEWLAKGQECGNPCIG